MNWEFFDQSQIRKIRHLAIEKYSNIFGEDASSGSLSALHLMYEAGYASVEFELNLSKATANEQKAEEGKSSFLAWGLKEVMLDSMREAHEVALESELIRGLW